MGGRASQEEEQGELAADQGEGRRPPCPAAATPSSRSTPTASRPAASLEEIAADPERVWQSNRGREDRQLQGQAPPRPPRPWRRRRRRRRPREEEPRPAAVNRRRDPGRPQGGDAGADRARSSPRWSTRSRRGDGVDPRDQVRRLPRLCEIRDGEARLITRNGKDWTDRFAPVAREARDAPRAPGDPRRRGGGPGAGRHHQLPDAPERPRARTGRTTSSTSPSTSSTSTATTCAARR